MATTSLSLLHATTPRSTTTTTSCYMSPRPLRRRSLPLLLLLSPAISTLSFNVAESKARDIPLFGLRDKIEKVEEVVKEEIGKVEEEIVKAEEEVKEEIGKVEEVIVKAEEVVVVKAEEIAESKARDIPLFGLRDKIDKVEEVVKEEIGKVEEVKEDLEIGVGGLVQAAVVAGVEAVAVLVGITVVNGILGPKEA